ncbi:MAG TPA: putative metal-binding motif-containing protein [Candidatus Nanoarchaeia archaeon]|nr:putative metal-binding motif-containing protein [Candidatus Nanoarchaeia archaeon]
MARKSQASMEFLLVYGWVILAGIITFAALYQYTIIPTGSFVACNIGGGLTCVESKITESGVDLYIQNSLPVALRNVYVNIVNIPNGIICTETGPKDIPALGKQLFSLECNIKDEGQFTGDIVIKYIKEGSGIQQQTTGNLLGKSVKDKTAPTITITSPIEGNPYNSPTVNLEYFVSDKGTIICSYVLDDKPKVALPNCDDEVVGPMNDGSHTIIVYATDISGNEASKSVSFSTLNEYPVCPDNDGDTITALSCGGLDCNDNNVDVYLGAIEFCDGIDNNCDGTIDENCNVCPDNDQDTYYNQTCGGLDCNDNDVNINPMILEDITENPASCSDNLDNDCDLLIDGTDPGCGGAALSCDADKDGYLNNDVACEGNDCNDNDVNVNPGVDELCGNGIDDNCNLLIDECNPVCGNNICEVGETEVSCLNDCHVGGQGGGSGKTKFGGN